MEPQRLGAYADPDEGATRISTPQAHDALRDDARLPRPRACQTEMEAGWGATRRCGATLNLKIGGRRGKGVDAPA